MTPYDPRRWTSHLLDVEGSMVREIMGRVTATVVWSAFVVSLLKLVPWMIPAFTISSVPHALIGTVLGLLLVFRTNSSYDRFWEGRKQWGSITNETRNLARQSSVWLASDPNLMREIIAWVIGFPFATMQRIRNQPGIGTSLTGVSIDDVAKVEKSKHIPLAVARMITSRLLKARERGLIDSIQLVALDQNVQQLIDYCGACERIRWTPMPFAYAVHLRRFLILYCFTLPLALTKDLGWATIPISFVIAYSLFGIEEIGVEIEDPFGSSVNDLPLKSFCEGMQTVLSDVRDNAAA